jgi:hypothetical protein
MIPESISFTEEEFVTRKLAAFRRRRHFFVCVMGKPSLVNLRFFECIP